MKIQVLGSGNAFNQQSRFNSSYLITSAQGVVLVDFGFTTLLALQQNQIPLDAINTIFITHYHGDHFGGLPAFFLAKKYIAEKGHVALVGPGPVAAKVKELQSVLYQGTEGILEELPIQYFGVEAGKSYNNPFPFEVVEMKHSDPSLPVGYILEIEGKKIGFSGDTCWHEGIEPFVNACDYVILECNFTQKIGEGHISVEELEASAVIQNNKEHIYLTHLYEGSAELALSKGYNTLEDGQILNF